MFNISFAMGIQNSRKAQWVHLFSMNFNGFRSFCLYFSLKCPFAMIKSSHSGNTIYMQLLSMNDSTKIELFYFDDNFLRIAQWVLALKQSQCVTSLQTQLNCLEYII